MDRASSRRQGLVNLAVSVVLLAWLARQVDLSELAIGLRSARWPLLLAGGALVWVGVLIRAWRWQLIANKDGRALGFSDALNVTFIGCALNILLPASMGDVAKSYYGYRRVGRKEVMLSSSLVDKILGLLAGFLVALPAAAWTGLWGFFVASALISMFLACLVFFPWLMPWPLVSRIGVRLGIKIDAQQLRQAAAMERRLLWVCLAMSAIGWALSFVQFYLAFLAFGHHASMGHVFALTPVIMLTKLVPLALDGLGPQEAVSLVLFKQVGVPESITLLATLAARALGSWLPGLIGIGLIALSSRSDAASSVSAPAVGEQVP